MKKIIVAIVLMFLITFGCEKQNKKPENSKSEKVIEYFSNDMHAKRKIKIINDELKPAFQKIEKRSQDFYEENGYKPFISQLNLSDLYDSEYFSYDLTDSAIIATTKNKFGKPTVKIIYNVEQDRWDVVEE